MARAACDLLRNCVWPGLGRRRALVVLTWLACVFLPTFAMASTSRAVAVLYDDSGSMNRPTSRWIGANFSLQVMASLLNEGDVLLMSKMNAQPQPKRYEVPGDIDALLSNLRAESAPKGETPYAGIEELLQSLKDSKATEKWLLVVTDGEFNGFSPEVAQRQIDTLVKPLGIRVVFLLIESGSDFKAARYWQKAGGATVVQAASGSEVPVRMEEIATMLTGRDANGISLVRDGNDLVISSRFPLRGVVALLQGDSGTRISSAIGGPTVMTLRSHLARSRQRLAGIPEAADIAHVLSKEGVAAGDQIMRLRLSGPGSRDRIKIYPEVAARMEVKVFGSDGKALQRDSQGYLSYCQDEEIDLRTQLIGTDDKPITIGRSDLSSFEIGFTHEGSAPLRSVIDSKQEAFAVRTKLTGNLHLLPFARYPGYFSYLGAPLNLRGVRCKSEIAITLESQLSSDGVWAARVDRLKSAAPLVFAVSVDGRPATELDLKGWQWQGDMLTAWDLQVAGGKVYLRPRSGCCALTWSRPKAQRGMLQVQNLTTGNARDVIRLPAPVPYEWTLPDSQLEKLWWLFGCPIAALLSLIAAVAYLWRILITKERFGRRSAVHVLRRRTDTKVPFCRARDLPKRWLWPSRRETKVVEGLKFMAVGGRGHAVLVVGAGLTEHHEIDGWQYDEQLQALKRPQRDARLRDQAIIARRTRGGYRAEDVDLKLQYVQRGQPSNWSQ